MTLKAAEGVVAAVELGVRDGSPEASKGMGGSIGGGGSAYGYIEQRGRKVGPGAEERGEEERNLLPSPEARIGSFRASERL